MIDFIIIDHHVDVSGLSGAVVLRDLEGGFASYPRQCAARTYAVHADALLELCNHPSEGWLLICL